MVLFTMSVFVHAQDIPLFSQKLTNSFIYNPALAGHTFGSITFAHRKSFTGVSGSPTNNFFSLHTPIKDHKFGVGANFYSEQAGIANNIYTSGAFAYHLPLGGSNTLSMGVSVEYNRLGFDVKKLNFEGGIEPQLDTESGMDFSFGVNYSHKYFKAGIAVNRLASSLEITQDADLLSEFYSGYVAGLIPFRNGLDILEPTFTFRKLSELNNIWEAGLYYTYNNMILVGAALRKGDIINVTAGFQINKKLLLGYSYELVNNNIGSDLGASSEITLRYDFNNITYQDRFKSSYKNAIAFRKKTLSNSSSARKRAGVKGPKSSHKRSKKMEKFSPNKRYSQGKKLKSVKHKGMNTNKRRKQNFKRNKKRRKKSKNRRYR
jgi:type IX secretion system PorP/SprF family membrane protein